MYAKATQRTQRLHERAPLRVILIQLVCQRVSADQNREADFGCRCRVTGETDADATRCRGHCGMARPKGVHAGIHCFRHGVTTELLEHGTPIHIVTRVMRQGDPKVTLDHYAHIVGDAERKATETFSRRLEQNLAQLESGYELESESPQRT